MKILHIYSGSQASGGLYLKKIVDVLNETGNYRQETIVSYHYPFASNSKVFFRFTDLAANVKKTKFRLALRYLELTLGLLYALYYTLYFKPSVINYSLNSAYKVEHVFLYLVKKLSKTKLFLTCHDVIPFKSRVVSASLDIRRRKKFFELADKLIVHNESSKYDLIKYYNQSKDKIQYHPFPIMDLGLLDINESEFEIVDNYDFCFLGHLREEKGLGLLLEAWQTFHKIEPEAKLIIAGNKTSYLEEFDSEELKTSNITLIDKYLPDALYYNIIRQSRCIVLPYLKGTNSGVLSTIISTNINIVASDIPLFKDHPLINHEFLFESENIASLIDCLALAYKTEPENQKRLNKIDKYEESFKENLEKVYDLRWQNN